MDSFLHDELLSSDERPSLLAAPSVGLHLLSVREARAVDDGQKQGCYYTQY